MKIKLKGICVDINKPRELKELQILKTVCIGELEQSSKPKKAFLNMVIRIINRRVKQESLVV
jgi:hypothetical protein